jgi:peptidoglycan/LPS O-acetylase OafA/YrhL
MKLNTRPRFPELDLLRFLAACAVMLFHYTYRGPRIHAWPASFPILGHIFKYGYLGVDVFFILSGFVILLTAYEKDAVAFTIARMIRLYPAYWVCVTLTTLAIIASGNVSHTVMPKQYFANLTMAHSYFGVKDVSGVYWTLAVELKFYFLIFVILLMKQAHRVAYLLGVWLIASVLLSVVSLGLPGGVLRFFLFPESSSYFIAGAMFFLIYRDGPSLYKLCVIFGCFLLSAGYIINVLPAGNGDTTTINAPVLLSLLAAFYLIFVGITFKQRSGTSNRSSGSLNLFYVLGMITYPLYLIHQDIGYMLLRSASSMLNQNVLLCMVIAAMIALSWLIHVGPEKWLALCLKTFIARIRKTSSRLKPASMSSSPFTPAPQHIASSPGVTPAKSPID